MTDPIQINIRDIPRSGDGEGTRLVGRKSNVPVQICESIGRRQEQQDQYFVTHCEILTAEVAKRRLESAFTYANERTTPPAQHSALAPHMNSGTCATVAVISNDRFLTVANVGDSPAVLYVVGKDKKVTPYALNKLHKPNDEDEKRWIIKHGGTVDPQVMPDGRVIHRIDNTGLSVSRTLGNWKYKQKIRRTPDITQINLDDYVKPGEKAFLCVSCDGFYEKGISELEYAEIIRQAIETGNTRHIARFMKDYAIERGSKDNLTLLFARVPDVLNDAIVMGVCDGHGGNDTAKQAYVSLRRDLERDEMSRPRAPHIEPSLPRHLSAAQEPKPEIGEAPTFVEGSWQKELKTGDYLLLAAPLGKSKREQITSALTALNIPVNMENKLVWRVEAKYSDWLKTHLCSLRER